MLAAITLGAWAGRRILNDPERFVPSLKAAWIGLPVTVLGGAPVALMVTGPLADTRFAVIMLAGALHTVTGYIGGFAFGALFGLIAVSAGNQARGVLRSFAAAGRRSLSCYLAQSVVFAAVLAWLLVLVVAVLMDRANQRGPFEVLLRKLS